MNSGGQVINIGATIGRPLSLTGNGWLESAGTLGALRFIGGSWTGPVTLTGNTRITVFAAAEVGTVSGVIDDGAGTFNLEKMGAGVLTLSNNNLFDGVVI